MQMSNLPELISVPVTLRMLCAIQLNHYLYECFN